VCFRNLDKPTYHDDEEWEKKHNNRAGHVYLFISSDEQNNGIECEVYYSHLWNNTLNSCFLLKQRSLAIIKPTLCISDEYLIKCDMKWRNIDVFSLVLPKYRGTSSLLSTTQLEQRS